MRLPPVLAMSMSERSSVAVPARSWRGMFLVLLTVSFIAKVVIACTLSPFGDEAFYWQESLAPAWGYSDLPPLTAWLIALSEGVLGHGLFAMRLPFLLIGACVPWQVAAIARRYGGDAERWQAATFALVLPLVEALASWRCRTCRSPSRSCWRHGACSRRWKPTGFATGHGLDWGSPSHGPRITGPRWRCLPG